MANALQTFTVLPTAVHTFPPRRNLQSSSSVLSSQSCQSSASTSGFPSKPQKEELKASSPLVQTSCLNMGCKLCYAASLPQASQYALHLGVKVETDGGEL
eukprot:2211205-Amphidinium_carterae.1